MELTKEEFDAKFKSEIDNILIAMALHEDINPDKFYSMTCILENLAFFSPVIYGLMKKPDTKQ